ncbi:hypothetical protein OK016_21830 [Vibrio chagasii]|nr:hypothetical protein [Vibrio chagasii]
MEANGLYDKLDGLEWQSDLYKTVVTLKSRKSHLKTPSVKSNNISQRYNN